MTKDFNPIMVYSMTCEMTCEMTCDMQHDKHQEIRHDTNDFYHITCKIKYLLQSCAQFFNVLFISDVTGIDFNLCLPWDPAKQGRLNVGLLKTFESNLADVKLGKNAIDAVVQKKPSVHKFIRTKENFTIWWIKNYIFSKSKP